jgi:hypothetical protein
MNNDPPAAVNPGAPRTPRGFLDFLHLLTVSPECETWRSRARGGRPCDLAESRVSELWITDPALRAILARNLLPSARAGSSLTDPSWPQSSCLRRPTRSG